MSSENAMVSSTVRAFNVREAREIISHHFTPQPWIYVLDLLCSATIGWSTYAIALGYPLLSTPNLAFVTIAVLAFFRALNLIHPIFHLPSPYRERVRIAYNVVFGVPLLVPFFLYERSHEAHHKRSVYGTLDDPEYIRFKGKKRFAIPGFLGLNLMLPFALLLRFGVLTSISHLHHGLRHWVLRSVSSFAVRRSFKRPLPSVGERTTVLLEESAATIYIVLVSSLTIASLIPAQILLQGLFIGVCLALMNAAQFLTLHRYDEPGPAIDMQLLDTWNNPGTFVLLTELWAPVGQRFHALHHCFPTLPYYNLARAHRELKHHLPATSIYHGAQSRGFVQVIYQLWRRDTA